MNTADSLTEIGKIMAKAEQDPITILDVMALINRQFAKAGKNLIEACDKNSRTAQAVPQPEVAQAQLSAAAAGVSNPLGQNSILAAASDGLEIVAQEFGWIEEE